LEFRLWDFQEIPHENGKTGNFISRSFGIWNLDFGIFRKFPMKMEKRGILFHGVWEFGILDFGIFRKIPHENGKTGNSISRSFGI
jgi:hypothetical protein